MLRVALHTLSKSDCLVSSIPLAYVTLTPPILQVFAYGCDSGNRLRPLLPRVFSLLVIAATVLLSTLLGVFHPPIGPSLLFSHLGASLEFTGLTVPHYRMAASFP